MAQKELMQEWLKNKAVEIFIDRDIEPTWNDIDDFNEVMSQINKRDMDCYDSANFDAWYYSWIESTYQALLNIFRAEIVSSWDAGDWKKYTSASLEVIIENLMK